MSTMNPINFPKTTNLNPSILTKNPNTLIPYPFSSSICSTLIAKTLNPCKRNPSLFLTLCSSKPQIENDNTIDGNSNSTVELPPNSIDPQNNQPKPISKQPQSSTPTPPLSTGLIFDLGPSGCWDSIEIGSPVVKRFLSDDEERWYMWYYGRSQKNPDSDLIGLAISGNGIHWQRGEQSEADSSAGIGLVMNCGGDWWAFDTKSIRPSEIMIMSSNKVRASTAVYWLYYTGFSSEEVELPQDLDLSLQFGLFNPERPQFDPKNGGICGFGRVFKSLPGLAISQDGRNWARIEGDHHSGALIDVGQNGEFDSLFIASPHVVFHSTGDLRMYYHSFDPQDGKFAIGIARSRDGIKWVKLGKIIGLGGGLSEGCFDEMGVMNACVVRDNKVGNYLMAYEGVGKDGKRGIGLAVSPDGLKDWKRVGPVLMPSLENGWDSNGVRSPCLVQMDGDEDRWRLYYTGVGVEGRTGIGLAVCQGSEITSFRRWAGFHL